MPPTAHDEIVLERNAGGAGRGCTGNLPLPSYAGIIIDDLRVE